MGAFSVSFQQRSAQETTTNAFAGVGRVMNSDLQYLSVQSFGVKCQA